MKANVAYKPEDMDGSDKALVHLSLEIAGKSDAVTACGVLITPKWTIDYNDIVVTCPKCLKWSGVDEKKEIDVTPKVKPEKGTNGYIQEMVERLLDAAELYIEVLETEAQETKENVDWDTLDEIEYYKEAVDELKAMLKL